MFRVRTKPTESAGKRDILKNPKTLRGRQTRAEFLPPGPLLEYTRDCGANQKWCRLFYGGEFTAGE